MDCDDETLMDGTLMRGTSLLPLPAGYCTDPLVPFNGLDFYPTLLTTPQTGGNDCFPSASILNALSDSREFDSWWQIAKRPEEEDKPLRKTGKTQKERLEAKGEGGIRLHLNTRRRFDITTTAAAKSPTSRR